MQSSEISIGCQSSRCITAFTLMFVCAVVLLMSEVSVQATNLFTDPLFAVYAPGTQLSGTLSGGDSHSRWRCLCSRQ